MAQFAGSATIAAEAMTIVALATPPGRSGVAVIRLSGSHLHDILPLFGITPMPAARVATLATIRHPQTSDVIDRGLVIWFPGPHSFTGEDVAELQVHGSRAVIKEIIDSLTALPICRLAEPGEFSRRAFIHGKMDLLEAEGLADLIDAETSGQRRQALRQMGGESGRRIESFRGQIVQAMALIEAYIDFPDEEIPESVVSEMAAAIDILRHEINQVLTDEQVGEKIRDGLTCVILGAPNAGKSSLLNTLARRDAAIVSDIAGTTRDLIEVDLDLNGQALRLIDTAGLRDTIEPIEREGIARARDRARHADFNLLLFDATEPPDAITLAELDDRSLVVLSKCDLSPGHAIPDIFQPHHPILLSSQTGDGIAELIVMLQSRIESLLSCREAPVITRLRHRRELESAFYHLSQFSPKLPIELQAEELRLAATHLGKITGKISVDDVLDLVFSQFCIGK